MCFLRQLRCPKTSVIQYFIFYSKEGHEVPSQQTNPSSSGLDKVSPENNKVMQSALFALHASNTSQIFDRLITGCWNMLGWALCYSKPFCWVLSLLAKKTYTWRLVSRFEDNKLQDPTMSVFMRLLCDWRQWWRNAYLDDISTLTSPLKQLQESSQSKTWLLIWPTCSDPPTKLHWLICSIS